MKSVSNNNGKSDKEYESLLTELERWRTVERLTDIIWSVDMSLKFTYVSPSVEKLIGYTQDEIMEISLDQLLTPESVSLIQQTLDEGLARESSDSTLEIPPPIDVKAKHRDGTSIWLELSRVFVRDKENKVVGILGVARDISDRVRAAQALEESEAKYRALTEKSVLGVAIAQDNPLRLAYLNDTMEDILGYSKEEMTNWRGEETARLIHPEDREKFLRVFKDRIEGRPVPKFLEFRAVQKDSGTIWLEVRGKLIEYQSGPAALATFVDITERYLVRKEVERERNFAEFLIDLMSHDLTNIHQGMMTALELISTQDETSAHTKALLENSLTQLTRAGGLISKVKTLSDVKSSTVELVRIDIHNPISKAIDSIGKTFPLREINVDFTTTEGMYFVWGCQFLFDVIYNLLHNAVKADVNEPVLLEIKTETVSDGTLLKVTVEDRGCGIPDSMKSSILDRLEDVKTTGSGIGLTLVKQIIERCKGKIWIEDRIKGDHSQGTKFIILLQLYDE